jgi:hypothetical protein
MSVEQEIKNLTVKLVENQDSSNGQFMLQTDRVVKIVDCLTESINKSSEASGKLTKTIINVTIAGVTVAILSLLLKLYELCPEFFN